MRCPRFFGGVAVAPALALLGLAACGPAAAPVTAGGGPHEECAVLHDRVSTAFVRLHAIQRDGKQDAAMFHAVADVMDKLARDLDRPFQNDRVRAIASDYQEAAKAVGSSTHEAAALLDAGEGALSRLGGSSKRLSSAVDRIAQTCRASEAEDCARVVGQLRSLGGGTPTSSRIQAVLSELPKGTYSSAGLREQVDEVCRPLEEMKVALSTAERMEQEKHAKVAAFDRSTAQLAGLNERADQVCKTAQ